MCISVIHTNLCTGNRCVTLVCALWCAVARSQNTIFLLRAEEADRSTGGARERARRSFTPSKINNSMRVPLPPKTPSEHWRVSLLQVAPWGVFLPANPRKGDPGNQLCFWESILHQFSAAVLVHLYKPASPGPWASDGSIAVLCLRAQSCSKQLLF